ncbi:MAG: acyl carrier protein [Thermoanaerobaculia bacterium]|nr:acyl carrier protein [Thermoanaerobaculia bacterium]
MAIDDEIRAVLRARNDRIELLADTPLGSRGLGLDSIAIVEVLLECEERLGIVIASDLLDGESLTVGRLIGRARAAAGST